MSYTMLSLNNRIYFREHQPPEHGDSVQLPVSERIRPTALSSLRFTIPEPQTEASKVVVFPPHPISRPGNAEYSESEDNSTDLSPPHPRISRTHPEDLEWTIGMSPHFHDPKDEIGGL